MFNPESAIEILLQSKTASFLNSCFLKGTFSSTILQSRNPGLLRFSTSLLIPITESGFKYLFFFILLSMISKGYGQNTDSIEQEYEYYYLKDSSGDYISMQCGSAGSTSINLWYINNLIIWKRFDLLQKLLYSPTPATRYLAAKSLIIAQNKSGYKSDSAINVKIDSLKLDCALVPFCAGCTIQENLHFTNLNSKMKETYVNNWIKNSFKPKSEINTTFYY